MVCLFCGYYFTNICMSHWSSSYDFAFVDAENQMYSEYFELLLQLVMFLVILHEHKHKFSATSFSKNFCNKKNNFWLLYVLLSWESFSYLDFSFSYVRVTISFLFHTIVNHEIYYTLVLNCQSIINQWSMVHNEAWFTILTLIRHIVLI